MILIGYWDLWKLTTHSYVQYIILNDNRWLLLLWVSISLWSYLYPRMLSYVLKMFSGRQCDLSHQCSLIHLALPHLLLGSRGSTQWLACANVLSTVCNVHSFPVIKRHMTRDGGRQERKEGQRERKREESPKLGIQAIGSIRLLFWGFKGWERNTLWTHLLLRLCKEKKSREGC